MRLVEKTDKDYYAIQNLTDEVFHGIERPNKPTLRFQYDNGDVFVHKNSERVVSYVIVTHWPMPYIWSVATTREWQGAGLASGLINEVVSFYSSLHEDVIELTVKDDNPAQKLYFDLGFRVIRVVPRHYGEVNGLRMRKYLY